MSDPDARFEDGEDRPLRLVATDPEDLQVLSSLVQDAVLPVSEISWQPQARRFAMLINRFRWEDRPAAELGRRDYERVRSVLAFDDVLGVASQGIARGETDTVLSILSVTFTPTEAPSGEVEIVLAGDGALKLSVECLEATLTDVTRPYAAPSRTLPRHPGSD